MWWAVVGGCCVVGDMCRAVGGGRLVADGVGCGIAVGGCVVVVRVGWCMGRGLGGWGGTWWGGCVDDG